MSYPIGVMESERLRLLRDLRILGTPPERQFDAVCRTAARLFDVPIVLVSLIEEDRQWFKARCGLDVDGTSREVAFCTYAILEDRVLVVEDASRDARFAANPLVTGAPHIRFYAGAPLVLEPGLRVGTLCIIDRVPRAFSPEDRAALADLAEIVVAHLRLHKARVDSDDEAATRLAAERRVMEQEADLRRTTTLLTATLDNMDEGLFMIDAEGVLQVCNSRAAALLDLPPDLVAGKPHFRDVLAHQMATGDLPPGWTDLQRDLVAGNFAKVPPIYRRTRPNGTVLEIRTVPLPGGGAVRTFADITERTRAQAALAESEARYRTLADALPQMVWIFDPAGRATYANRALRDYLGADPWDAQSERVALNHPDDMARVIAARDHAFAAGTTLTVEGRLRRHDGVYRWHKLVAVPVRRGDEIVEWIATSLDIDDIVQAQEKLRQTTALISLAQEGAGAGLFDWNLQTGEAHLSVESLRLFGLPESHPTLVAGHEWESIIDPRDWPAIRAEVDRAVATGTAYKSEFRVRRADGGIGWLMGLARLVHDEAGVPQRLVGLNLDITERKQAEERLALALDRAEHQARHDALTELPNRSLFRERLNQCFAAARRRRQPFALHLLDLDRLKIVNDTLGHQVGDALLQRAAQRLKAAIRDEDTLARLGGDEFAVIQAGVGNEEGARLLAQRLVDALAKPFSVRGHQINAGLSVGIALAPADGTDVDALVKNADLALYRAKEAGRNTFRFYEPAMDAAQHERQALELDLRRALLRDEFHLHYQPQLDLASGEVAGCEALVRWGHPTHGAIAPGRFVPLAEETGLIVPLGEWVLREACREAASWPGALRVSVNVSAVQFRQPGLVQSVVSALAATGLPAARLELEVTETVLIREAEALATLHQLRALGVRIALDDFGTGYSSLSYLRRFPFDKLKIDRSFVNDIDNPDTAAIVRAMVGLGTRLGMTITAEGVETREQMERVRAEGCTEIQGFLISRPTPARDALALVAQRRGLAAAS